MKRTIVLAFALAAFSVLPAGAAPYSSLSWRSIGPATAGGRVPAVAGSPQNPFLYYLGTAGGGIWKTENGGQTWTPVFTKQDVAAIGAIAVDPNDQDDVWAGTGEANPRNDVIAGDGIYHSSDGGKTWKNMGLAATRHIAAIAIDPQNAKHVVVAALGPVYRDSTARGVYVTFDGGATWKKTLYLAPDSGAGDLAMDPKDPNVLYAGMWQFRRQPWTFSSGGPNGGLYKSTDGGRTWHRITGNGFPTGLTGRIGLAVAPSNPNRVYALVQSHQGVLWRSDDAGVHWTRMFDGTLIDQRPFYFSHLAVDPVDQNRVYALSMDIALSTDGGKTFKRIGTDVHADTHAIWIAPNDAKRLIIGDDGGFALSIDRGKNFWFSRNLPIEQVYHVDLSNENPYGVCAALQDNQAYCGPSNSRSYDGITGRDWYVSVGGDGVWSVFDPANPRYIMADSEDGWIVRYDRRSEAMRSVFAYESTSAARFDLRLAKYRFNWNSPIAYAPWDPHVLWFGGNVVFQSRDRGEHWTPISPDLTRNVKAHQAPSGGPITKDVFGTEYSDTILDIEGSPVAKGEIWVGTDDGLVQLTRDNGAHWKNVTPPGVPAFGRVETVAPSPLSPGTAYASIDRHRSGDDTPYLFVTTNYGKTWRKIVNGLPSDDFVRTVRPDLSNSQLLFAGTERGLYVSVDAGANWQNMRNNMPVVSVRDLRIAPADRDLVAGTHGLGIYIMDDITPLEHLKQAESRGFMLFAPRTAYRWTLHSDQQGLYGRFSGQNPPDGAVVSFYQSAVAKNAPVARIYDASGKLVRTISGTHKVNGKSIPWIPNKPGVNRFVWDLNATPAVQWNGAARPFRVFSGPPVPPGTYTVKLTAGAHTATQRVTVKADPAEPWTQAQYEQAYAFNRKYVAITSNIDTALNNLDAMAARLQAAKKAAAGNPALQQRIAAAQQERSAVFAALTANYRNGEDFALREGSLREDLPAGLSFSPHPPTAETLRFAKTFDTRYRAAMQRYNAFVKQTAALLHAGT